MLPDAASDGPSISRLTPASLTGAILCGGRSRRLGQDKALAEVSGQDLLARAIQLLRPRVHEVLLACGPAPRYESRGLRLAVDGAPDLGPLGGLRAALEAATTDWVLLLACDMPTAEAAVAALLCAEPGTDQVLYFEHEGPDEPLPEPLCALYHRDVLPAVEAALARGRRRMISFWPDVRRRALRPPGSAAFHNVNTPEDLDAVRQRR